MKRRSVAVAINLVLIVIGLVAVAGAVTMGLNPKATCHGRVMHAGDTCRRLQIDGSDRGKTQSYEDAIAEQRNAVPVVVGLGVLAVGFGAVLLRGALRADPPAPRRSPSPEPPGGGPDDAPSGVSARR